MKWFKKILAVCSFCTLLTTANCFAVTMDETKLSEDKMTCYKTYQVMESEKDTFLEMLLKEIEIDGIKYKYTDYTAEGGNVTETIDINTTKTILSNTNNKVKIIEQLGDTIKYEEDRYVGEYTLNTDTLKIKTNYNGFREELIEKTINYTNLEKNDLNYIPKQTTKDGLTLDLLSVDWQVESTKMIGEYEVANTYTAKCYYATKQRVNYPNTYTVTAEYFGTATKTEENPITYVIQYEKEETEAEEKQESNLIPLVGSTTGIVLVIIFFLTGNVTVYNYRDGEYKRVGKTRATRKGIIKLDRFSLFEKTNKYKIELSKNLSKKLDGKLLTVTKNGINIKMLVKSDKKEKYVVNVRV